MSEVQDESQSANELKETKKPCVILAQVSMQRKYTVIIIIITIIIIFLRMK